MAVALLCSAVLCPTVPAHGVGERTLEQVIILYQQLLHDTTQAWKRTGDVVMATSSL